MTCEHIKEAKDLQPQRRVCEDCIKMGDSWVHLRICLTCGHVGCCDSSKNKHATKHFHTTSHPVMRSLEPGESWGWCFVDEITYDLSRGTHHARAME
ncbi:MAG TPA: UBP-type zinc finger domain-containing protein [Bryobacteraceae bacterium]|nr:UBP-type zinc finger domain-containing protein [Bryobacteraceae bacterium]